MERSALRARATAATKTVVGWLGLEIHRKRVTAPPLQLLCDLQVRTVLDVGANRGQFAGEIRRILPAAVIHSFEPVAEPYAALAAMAARDERLVPHDFALSDENGETSINVNEFSPASSILPLAEVSRRNFPYASRTRAQRIRMRRLDDWAAEAPIEVPFFVKLDVQGAEDRVIRGGQNTLRRALGVLSEVAFVRMYEGQPLFDDIYEQLHALGFRCGGIFGSVFDSSSGRPLYGDALFLRPDANAAARSFER